MTRRIIISIFIIFKFTATSSQQICSDCFKDNGVEWCTNEQDLNTSTYSRCLINNDDITGWTEWCGSEFVYHPSNTVTIIEDEPYTNPEKVQEKDKVIQIRPQLVNMELTTGKSETLDLSFKFVRGYFLELYYLMDMSKSMEQDKETIVSLADDLATELKMLTPNLKLGFGSFLDKVMLPYVNTHESWLENPCNEEKDKMTCRKPYGYQNILSLTNDTDLFIESVNNAKLSTNWDDPEGGLDALIQAMVCEDIGWQTTTTRHLIVYVSGSAFKYAGDGKLAGLTLPNDMKCHLDLDGNYIYSSVQDYPSVSQIEYVSKNNRMHLIFAVKENVLPLYKALTGLIVQSDASELKDDSSNIIEIITSIYEDISSTVILTDDSYKSPHVTLTYAAKCGKDKDYIEGSSKCEDVDINEEIHFKVNFQISKCTVGGDPITVKLSPQGLEDELSVQIKQNCDCECEDNLNTVQEMEVCSYNGKFACGVCVCNKRHTGKHCECDDEEDSTSTTGDKCRPFGDQTGRDCSGHGLCKCGECECHSGIDGNRNWKYQGDFCECSNFDCPKSSGFLCSNNGRCDCSKCLCNTGWHNEACSCDARKYNCINPATKKICSGHGICKCNECRCFSLESDKTQKYFGKFCEDCESCEGRCEEYNNCIMCMMFYTGPYLANCNDKCSKITIIKVDSIEGKKIQKRCSYKDENGCLVISAYEPTEEKEIVYVQKEPNCSGKVKFYVVIGSMVGLILIIGFLILIIWKCLVTLKDKREYKKFIRESEQVKFTHQINPIYKDPVTRITNPLREVEN